MQGTFTACVASGSGKRSISAKLTAAAPATATARALGFSSIGGGICSVIDNVVDANAVSKSCETPQTVKWGGRLEF